MTTPSPLTELQVDHRSAAIVIRSALFAQSQPWETAKGIVGRLLAVDCVASVSLDRTAGSVTLNLVTQTRYDDRRSSTRASGEGNSQQGPIAHSPRMKDLVQQPESLNANNRVTQSSLQSIISSLRGMETTSVEISDDYASHPRLQLNKTNGGPVTAGTIVHRLPGRIRVRHPLLQGDGALAHRVKTNLSRFRGVRSVWANSATSSVLIAFDTDVTHADELLSVIEMALTDREAFERRLKGPSTSRWVASGACLGLAIASEFFVPVIAPVTAIALVGFNVPTLVRGVFELARLKWGIASLYTVIMGTTLISGQFLAAALMQASMTCWHGWTSHRLRRIVNSLKHQTELPLVLGRSHHNLLVSDANFPDCLIGTSVIVESGSLIPYDGIVVAGSGEIDERCVHGIDRIATRSIGDQVFAGSTVLNGQIELQVTAATTRTRLAKVRQTLLATVSDIPGQSGPTQRSSTSAARFVPFTFATGTAALMFGDITTLAAVLRPDFTTGPSISEQFGILSSISHLWDQGWLVKNAGILPELARASIVVHVDDRKSDLEEVQVQIRSLTHSAPNLQIHEISGDSDQCLDYIRKLAASGRPIAVIGSGPLLRQLAEDQVIRISDSPNHSIDEPYVDLVGMHPTSRHIEQLWRVLHETRRPGTHGWAAVMTVNALAISGAFLAGLTSLHVVAITNLGALAASAFYGRHLRKSSQIFTIRPEIGVRSGFLDAPRDRTSRDTLGSIRWNDSIYASGNDWSASHSASSEWNSPDVIDVSPEPTRSATVNPTVIETIPKLIDPT